jgi:hypothetical protein
MHHSGDQRRGIAKSCLECLGCLKIEVAVREANSQNALVMPGLDPGIHQSSQEFFEKMDHQVEPGDDGSLWCRRVGKAKRAHHLTHHGGHGASAPLPTQRLDIFLAV